MLQRIIDFFRLGRIGATRSGAWPTVEKQFLKANPTCSACGTNKHLNVHHIQPFHLNPQLELDTSNLITLCRVDHFTTGHLKSWASWNKDVRSDASNLLQKIIHRP